MENLPKGYRKISEFSRLSEGVLNKKKAEKRREMAKFDLDCTGFDFDPEFFGEFDDGMRTTGL